MKSFLFFDLETGGLDPATNAITQLGICYVTLTDDFKPLIAPATSYCWNVKPRLEITEAAAKIQGATISELFTRDGITESELLAELEAYLEMFDPSIPVYAWNAAFDTSFMNALVMRNRGPIDRVGKLHGRLVRCARQLGLIAYDLGYLPSASSGGFSLKVAAEHFGLVQQEPHDALADAKVGAEVLAKIIGLIGAKP